MGASTSAPTPANMGIEYSWPPSIQCLAMELNQAPSFLDNPTLIVLLIESALSSIDLHCMNGLEIDELFYNILHFVLESALCAYVAKEHHKTLRRELGTQEMDRRLLMEDCSRLKTRVKEVEGTMKETLESVNKP